MTDQHPKYEWIFDKPDPCIDCENSPLTDEQQLMIDRLRELYIMVGLLPDEQEEEQS